MLLPTQPAYNIAIKGRMVAQTIALLEKRGENKHNHKTLLSSAKQFNILIRQPSTFLQFLQDYDVTARVIF